jgi:glycerol-3-phosphate dehydrogenase
LLFIFQIVSKCGFFICLEDKFPVMAFNRPDQFKKLDAPFDLCIIGGGASGAGVALDATLRGYRVLLIEKGDFASQTSSKSTKLVHGGVRYLEQAVKKLDWQQFKMVYKALHERKVLLQNAPFLAHPLALLTPCYSWFDRIYYRIGMWMYDQIAGHTNLEPSRGLSQSQMRQVCPNLSLDHVRGGVMYTDGQLDDARYALAILQSAEAAGACILNYAELNSFVHSPKSLKIKEVCWTDLISGQTFQIPVKAVVNATGPFTDHVRALANPKLKPRMKVSRGAHIVLSADFWPGKTALLIPKTDDGRVIFVIPWREYVLVGTTDEPDQLVESPEILSHEIDYLLDYFNRYSTKKAVRNDVSATFVGQRPLLQAALDSAMSTDTKSLVRDHEVEVDGRSKLVSIMGGKWTTYRVMAADTLDELEREVLNLTPRPCLTQDHTLFGGQENEKSRFMSEAKSLPADIQAHLWATYGSQAFALLALDLTRLHPALPYVAGELPYVKEHEMATCWDDVLMRRWGISLRNARLAGEIRANKKEAFAS